MPRHSLFTSESVSEGHPDKIADQVSDAILDALLEATPPPDRKRCRSAIETLVKTGMVVVSGEMRASVPLDMAEIEALVRRVVNDIGYDNGELGFDGNHVAVLNAIGKQSGDIAQGVDGIERGSQGAGDQGMMFGYACNETDVLMPAPITCAHRLMQRHAELRKSGRFPWLRPDAKSQVTLRYEDGKPVEVMTVVLSTQHGPEMNERQKQLQEAVIEELIKPVLPAEWLRSLTPGDNCHINPTGLFEIGGPVGDCGLTGRKIIVDTYGGYARHGGGAFSGKDPSKVDRSAAYAARHVAKNVVAAGLADRCELQVAYAIGVPHPVSLMVDTQGTGRVDETRIQELIEAHFDLSPDGIVRDLDLLRPIYRKTSNCGHFGRTEADFTWERTDKAEALREAAGL